LILEDRFHSSTEVGQGCDRGGEEGTPEQIIDPNKGGRRVYIILYTKGSCKKIPMVG